MNHLTHIQAGKALCVTRRLGQCAPVEIRDWGNGNEPSETLRGVTPKGPGRGERGVSITFRRNFYG